MFNLKEGTKFNITYFAKKYGKFITRAGVWTDNCKEGLTKTQNYIFTYYDLDNEGYRTASGDVTIVERKDN